MKIAAVTMVKNECDIIELFIKINSKYFDHFFILDHFSTDGTARIIKQIQNLGYPVTYMPLLDKIYNQASITTAEVRRVASLNIYDYIMAIDADEFIYSESPEFFRKMLASSVNPDGIGSVPWVTYCPVKMDYFNVSAPLYSSFQARKFEPVQYYKVILGNTFARRCSVAMGNHSAKSRTYKRDTVKLSGIQLQHVPVRSKEQIIRKAILGSHAFSMTKDRKKGEGFHWDVMADLIRKNGYSLSNADFFNLSINYAVPDGNQPSNDVSDQFPRVGSEDDKIEFTDLAFINLVESFDAEIGRLALQVKNIKLFNF